MTKSQVETLYENESIPMKYMCELDYRNPRTGLSLDALDWDWPNGLSDEKIVQDLSEVVYQSLRENTTYPCAVFVQSPIALDLAFSNQNLFERRIQNYLAENGMGDLRIRGVGGWRSTLGYIVNKEI